MKNMASQNTERPAPALAGNGPLEVDHAGERDDLLNTKSESKAQTTSKWRQTMRVHPAADVFPMLSDDELDALGADILAKRD